MAIPSSYNPLSSLLFTSPLLNRLPIHVANRFNFYLSNAFFEYDLEDYPKQLQWRDAYRLLIVVFSTSMSCPFSGSQVYVAPILGAIRLGTYINRVTKSVFTEQYSLMLFLLVSIREDKGLSQRALSKVLKKTPTYVSKYERGERRLDVVEFLEIVKILGADPHEIIKKLIA